jgi:hypothetical protein
MTYRTDENNNPSAFTTDVASEAGLSLDTDYIPGTHFPAPSTLVTAKLLGDPVALTIRVINALGFYIPKTGEARWVYMGDFPTWLWAEMTVDQRRDLIGYMYMWEGGVAMRGLFPNYGRA